MFFLSWWTNVLWNNSAVSETRCLCTVQTYTGALPDCNLRLYKISTPMDEPIEPHATLAGGGGHTNIRSKTLWFNIFSLRIACKLTLWNSWLHFLLHWNTLFNSAYGPLLDFSFWLEYKRTPLLAHTKTPGLEGKRALWWFICTPNLRVIPHISKGHFILI